MALIDNIKAYYNLDDVNDAANGNTLTNTGSVAFSAGLIRNGAIFDATNKRLERSTDNMWFTSSSSNSWSCWFKFNSVIITQYLIDNATSSWANRRAILILNWATSKISVYASGNEVIYATALTTGVWYHLCIVNTAGSYEGFINGASFGTVASGTTGGAVNYYSIGWAGDSFGANSNGILDEVWMWNRAITSSEVIQLYNSWNWFSYPFGTYPAFLLFS